MTWGAAGASTLQSGRPGCELLKSLSREPEMPSLSTGTIALAQDIRQDKVLKVLASRVPRTSAAVVSHILQMQELLGRPRACPGRCAQVMLLPSCGCCFSKLFLQVSPLQQRGAMVWSDGAGWQSHPHHSLTHAAHRAHGRIS